LLRETLRVIMKAKLGDRLVLGGPGERGVSAGIAAEKEIIA
jgi:hypothetical protein